MKSILTMAAALFSVNAFAVDPSRCPGKIDLEMDTIRARVHTSFTRDAGYKAGVDALNALVHERITYRLTARFAKSCEYTAEAGGALAGKASFYTKSIYDPEENAPVQVDTLRTSFWIPGIRAQFALFLVAEDYQSDSIRVYTTSTRERSLMALLTPPSGRKSHRESGKVAFTVWGSR